MSDTAPSARRESIFRWSLLGLAGLVLAGWMIYGALDTPTEPDNYTNGYSHSPGGHSALVELFEQNGRDVRVRAATLKLPAFDYGTGATLALLEPRGEFVREYSDDFRRVFNEAHSRECSLMMALPKRRYEYNRNEGEVEVIDEYLVHRHELDDLLDLAGLEDLLAIDRVDTPTTARLASGSDGIMGDSIPAGPAFAVPAPAQVFRWKRSPVGHYQEPKVLIETTDGLPMAVRLFPKHSSSQGGIVLLADPDLLGNRWLDQPGAATLAVALFRETPPRGELIFEETLHGLATDSSVEYLALTPPGLWVTLSLLLLLMLFGWREAVVVRPVGDTAEDRQARVYAVEGVARMMARARDHGAALRALVRRARLVLHGSATTVLAEGRAAEDKGVTRISYGTAKEDHEKLVNAAASIARKMRAHDDQDDNPEQGTA